MSTTTLEFQFKIGGVLTSATAVLLSSLDGSYGVKRTDTGEVLVADGEEMTEAQTGVYRYTLTVDPGVPLSWWAEPTYNAVAYNFERQTVSAVSTPAGYYASIDDVYAVGGKSNVDGYSTLDTDASYIAVRQQKALEYADAEIDRRFVQANVETPIPKTHPHFPIVQDIAATFALVWLYRANGTADNKATSVAGKMRTAQDDANAKLNNLCVPGRMNNGPVSDPEPDCPTTIEV